MAKLGMTAFVACVATAGIALLTSCTTNNQVLLPPPGAASKTAALVVGDPGTSTSNNGNKFEVFLPTDNGTIAPQAKVAGANTTMHRVESITRDAFGNFIVGDNTEGNPGGICTTTFSSGQILTFSRTAIGNVAPTSSIAGSNTTLDDSIDGVVLDASGNVYASQKDTTSDSCAPTAATGRILVFAAGAAGNVAPVKRIIGASTFLNSPRQLTIDSSGRLWTVDERAHDVLAFSISGLSSGDNNLAPAIRITSPAFGCPQGVAVDATSNVYVGDPCGASIYRFNAITSNCLACSPNATIHGSNTGFASGSLQLATDGALIYAGNDFGNDVLVFHVSDNGNVAPTQKIFDSTASTLSMRAISL